MFAFSALRRYKGFFKRNEHAYKKYNIKHAKVWYFWLWANRYSRKNNGILIPAHCFTPFKSYYGNCVDRMQNIFKEKFSKIFAIELGLSADTYLADTISELEDKTFITNSDAHSLPKIAREYNKMQVQDISFKEVVKALKNEEGRKVLCNYGLDPKLGKYHRTFAIIVVR